VSGLPNPDHHRNLTPAIRRLKAAYPWLFLEPSRAAVFAQKANPPTRLDWDKKTSEFILKNA